MRRRRGNGWDVAAAVGGIAFLAYKEHKRKKKLKEEQEAWQRAQATAEVPPKQEQPKVSPEELTRIYHSLSKKYHPDFAQSETDKKFRTELLKKINFAYEKGDAATLRMYEI
jgi:hypothetical protein